MQSFGNYQHYFSANSAVSHSTSVLPLNLTNPFLDPSPGFRKFNYLFTTNVLFIPPHPSLSQIRVRGSKRATPPEFSPQYPSWPSSKCCIPSESSWASVCCQQSSSSSASFWCPSPLVGSSGEAASTEPWRSWSGVGAGTPWTRSLLASRRSCKRLKTRGRNEEVSDRWCRGRRAEGRRLWVEHRGQRGKGWGIVTEDRWRRAVSWVQMTGDWGQRI